MATITAVRSSPGVNIEKIFWETLTETNADGSPHVLAGLSGVGGSVQITGTFGGTTIVLQGSNDGTNYETLKDPQGTAISFTEAGAAEVATAMLQVRPFVSGGTGVDLDVTLILRSQ